MSAAGDDAFEPTLVAAQRRLLAVRPSDYARTRNHLDGAATKLSPYLTHGMLTVPQVLATLHLAPTHKLTMELGWRAFFRHAWRHDGGAIFRSQRPGPLPDAAYAPTLPDDIAQGRTGLAVIDRAVRQLYATGWLHNHARLWLASYVVHLRKVHWRAGADWLYGHLLDGDLASNHLSWQWVAGTASHKPYLFNAENVRRYAPPDWHVDGSALDIGYDRLEQIARDPQARFAPAPGVDGMSPPDCHGAPADAARADPAAVAGRDVWLVHAWDLADPPPDRLAVAVIDRGFHARWPWSARRWRFVLARMQAIAPLCWVDRAGALVDALAGARSVAGHGDPHLESAFDRLALSPPPDAFGEPGRRCRSFSAWWAQVQPAGDPGQPGLFD